MQDKWYQNAVFYGVNVSRFYDTDCNGIGDLQGVIQKLDYIASLGIDCIWLLPFFPSARRDNGYDVTDYCEVDKELGSLEDFKHLISQAHQRNIKVIIDLVVHHTSDQHRWFQAAIKSRQSPYHDYYVWSDKQVKSPEDKPSFPGEEDSVWHYQPEVRAYYHHSFYHFEPDLNIANPQVWDEIKNIVDFWLKLDVNGFRLDAATFMFSEKGLPDTGVDANTHIADLRCFIEKRKPEAILLAEADVEPHRIEDYFGEGDRMHLLYNFLLNNSLFLALARGRSQPLQDRLRQLQDTARRGEWVNFVRNLDELNVEHLIMSEQEEVYEAFAPDRDMRIYDRGIRRRLTPMLQGDRQHIEMVYSLMFSLPGAPLFVYGDEIGMGDDLNLPGRDGVRLPMQWSDSLHGGFTEAPCQDEKLRSLPRDHEYGYRNINAANQDRDESSLLNYFRRLITVRKKFPVIGQQQPELVTLDNPAVLGLQYPGLLILHNLSAEKQEFVVAAPQDAKAVWGEDYPARQSLERYGFSWIQTA